MKFDNLVKEFSLSMSDVDKTSAGGLSVGKYDEVAYTQLSINAQLPYGNQVAAAEERKCCRLTAEQDDLIKPKKEPSIWSLCECDPNWGLNQELSQDDDGDLTTEYS